MTILRIIGKFQLVTNKHQGDFVSVPVPPKPGAPLASAVESNFKLASSSANRNASAIPLIVGLIFWLGSIGVVIYTNTNSLLDADRTETLVHLFGYLLTPIGVVGCFAWDMFSQRMGMHDINFFPRIKYTQILRNLTLTSFLIAWFHIEPIAKAIADSLAG